MNRIPLPALMPWRNAQFRRILNAIVPVGLLLLIILCGFLGHAAESPFAAPNDEIRYDNLCGPNCLYMLLEILGHSVTREEWQSWRPSNPDGMSMLELKHVCTRFGVTAEVRKCTNEDLRRVTYPVIAHMNLGTQRQQHFMLLTRVMPNERIEAIDGTTAQVHYFPLKTISNIWNGNLLIAHKRSFEMQWCLAAIAVLLSIPSFLFYLRGNRRAALMSFSLVMIQFVFSGTCLAEDSKTLRERDAGIQSADQSDPSAFWRKPENDGICCLFLQLRQLGYQERFADFLQKINHQRPASSLQDLVRIARGLGYQVVPSRTSIGQIAQSRLPLIVHLEQNDRDSGYFVIPLFFEGKQVVLFHGPTSSLVQMDIDLFRRQWTGVSLAPPAAKAKSDLWGYSQGLLLATIVGSLFLFWRLVF